MAAPEVSVPGDRPSLEGRSLRRYTIRLALALAALTVIFSAAPAILLPNQVQDMTFGTYFQGQDADVDVADLADLKSEVEDGTVVPDAEQRRLLDAYESFDSSRASALGLVATLAALASIISQVLVGVASDRTRSRLGRRAPWALAGAAAGCLALAGLRLSPSIAFLMLLWPLFVMAGNVVQTPLLATIADRVPENRVGGVSSATGVGNFAGGVVGIVVTGALFHVLGVDFYLLFGIVLLAAVAFLVFGSPDRSSRDVELPPFSWRTFLRGFLIPLTDADFRLVWVARALLFFGYTVSTALSFFILQSYVEPGMSPSEATRFVPILGAVSAPAILVAVVVAGRLSDKLGRRKPFVIAASALMAISFLIPLASPTVPALVAQAILGGLAFGIYLPVDQALFIDVLPDREDGAARDLGVAGIATNLGQLIGPVVAAGVVAATGGYRMIWLVAFVLVAAAAVAVVPVKRAR
ncbi:MFS transporter [Nocardioides sp. R-C-SC26]|uniref:MFS transporter n=1 Tax=Nocardioides sp. R-C-SC26 TaxID=2870414 RepID=UPI001E4D0F28|nr:MFS transporter [Nocardioides sp. R-C-SC26]